MSVGDQTGGIAELATADDQAGQLTFRARSDPVELMGAETFAYFYPEAPSLAGEVLPPVPAGAQEVLGSREAIR